MNSAKHWLSERLRKRRHKALVKSITHPTMHRLLSADSPSGALPAQSIDYLVVDLEMSGMDASQDQALSIGWVAISQSQIIHSTARHLYFTARKVDLANQHPFIKFAISNYSKGKQMMK